mgnify:CR=1 FL=1
MMKEVGKKISENRKKLKISQIEFAKNLNISNATLSQYESGDINIPLQKIVEISKILDITPNYLLGFEEKEDYKMNNYDLLEKNENSRFSIRINTEQGADKFNNIIVPILKNNIDDIIILDIDGKAYKKTEKFRRVVLRNEISKIDLFDDITESFNPFHYLNFENSIFFIRNIANIYLNDDNSDKLKLFKVVIANLFFKNKLENKDYKLSFPLIYDFIKKMGTERSIISDLELLNQRKTEEELRNNFNNKYFSYKNYFKSLKIMEEREINKKENIDIINKGLIPEYYEINKELMNLDEEKLINLKNELLQDLKIFSDEKIRLNTTKNTIKIPNCSDLINDFSKTTYFVVNEDKIKKIAPLIRIFYYLIIFKRTETEFWNYNFEDKRKRHNKLTIIMDNFAEIGKHTMLELSLGFIGGYGINCIIFANRNELKNIYGEKNGFFSNMDILKLSKNKIEYIYKKMENFTLNKSTIFIKNDELANENDINDIDKID